MDLNVSDDYINKVLSTQEVSNVRDITMHLLVTNTLNILLQGISMNLTLL